MPRHQRIPQYDLPIPDGIINICSTDLFPASGGGTLALTRIASGVWSQRLSTTTATVFQAAISTLETRFGMQDDLQEFYGSARAGGSNALPVGWPNTLSTSTVTAGAAVSIPVLSSVNFAVGQAILVDTVASGVQEYTYITAIADGTHITATLANGHTTPFPIAANVFTTPAGVSGSPPYTGVTQLTPVTAPRVKGILIKQITPRYIINTTNITVNTIGLTVVQYTNAVAIPAATVLLANAQNGMSLTAAATPYVTPIPIPVANQVYLNGRNSDPIIEWDITAAASGSVDVLGIEVVCSFNYT